MLDVLASWLEGVAVGAVVFGSVWYIRLTVGDMQHCAVTAFVGSTA